MLSGEERGDDVNWKSIYNEWANGTGPVRSIFEGDHEANNQIQSDYLYGIAIREFNDSGLSKSRTNVDFWPIVDNILVGTHNTQVQMMGSYNASFYKLGNKTLSLIQDSKSGTSFYYHLPVQRY
ncbi:hypothetical protein GCM10011418_23880 [Sphingobacterium alkalisoli]|nr:hypothetical protein GCM10011418_23880 [Sphingobacterium alkalisoli]